MARPTARQRAVVLCDNIWLGGEKHMNGDVIEARREDIAAVLEGDEAAGRRPRLTVIEDVKASAMRVQDAEDAAE